MLKGHKSKTDTETSSECCTCKVKETPEHFLLKCKEYDTEQTKLEKDIKEVFYKNNCHKLSITLLDDLLGECDLPSQDTIIGEKWKSLFRQQEKKFKKRKEKGKKIVIKLFCLNFFMYLFPFLSFFCLNILVYKLGV